MEKPLRNFESISPSAISLLKAKALTTIPFAKEAAALLQQQPDPLQLRAASGGIAWARVLHFESRYRSIDQLLEDTAITNILELASGLNFRGLAMATAQPVYYIDTDLPYIIDIKQQFRNLLQPQQPMPGTLEITALNALDNNELSALAQHFPPGPLAVVNEGLLMYLNDEEKKQVCKNIHALLTQRGGYWITADIYIRKEGSPAAINLDAQANQFLQAHGVEEKKFESFDAAKTFFQNNGFEIDRIASVDPKTLSSFPEFIRHIHDEQLGQLKKGGKMQETWRLRPA